MELEKELAEANERLLALLHKKSDCENVRSKICYEIQEEELNIFVLTDKINALSPELDEDRRFKLKEDFERIECLRKNLFEKDSLSLSFSEGSTTDYTLELGGTLRETTVTINTSSDRIKNLFRRAFRQEGHCGDDDESDLNALKRTSWHNGPYSCCFNRFRFNSEIISELYKESDENAYKMWKLNQR
jgi:hypothetical protein